MIPGITSPLLPGMDVVVSTHLRPYVWRQFRYPKSRRKRIRRKWAGRCINGRLVLSDGPDFVRIGNVLYCTPEAFHALVAKLGLPFAGGLGR